jgi:hypothetical protein
VYLPSYLELRRNDLYAPRGASMLVLELSMFNISVPENSIMLHLPKFIVIEFLLHSLSISKTEETGQQSCRYWGVKWKRVWFSAGKDALYSKGTIRKFKVQTVQVPTLHYPSKHGTFHGCNWSIIKSNINNNKNEGYFTCKYGELDTIKNTSSR